MKLNAVYFSFEFVCVKCCNFGLRCVPYIQSRVFGIRANFSITGFMSILLFQFLFWLNKFIFWLFYCLSLSLLPPHNLKRTDYIAVFRQS